MRPQNRLLSKSLVETKRKTMRVFVRRQAKSEPIDTSWDVRAFDDYYSTPKVIESTTDGGYTTTRDLEVSKGIPQQTSRSTRDALPPIPPQNDRTDSVLRQGQVGMSGHRFSESATHNTLGLEAQRARGAVPKQKRHTTSLDTRSTSQYDTFTPVSRPSQSQCLDQDTHVPSSVNCQPISKQFSSSGYLNPYPLNDSACVQSATASQGSLAIEPIKSQYLTVSSVGDRTPPEMQNLVMSSVGDQMPLEMQYRDMSSVGDRIPPEMQFVHLEYEPVDQLERETGENVEPDAVDVPSSDCQKIEDDKVSDWNSVSIPEQF